MNGKPRRPRSGGIATDDPGAAAEPAIRVVGLGKTFKGHLGLGRTRAVGGLDLEVRHGEIFGLLGPNGAGKTTTFKMLLGLLRPDRGEIRLLGLPPSDPRARARIGYLPENPYFYDHLSAREFLDFYGRLHGMRASVRREKTAEILRRVGLAGREDTALRKFSKGMTQRLGLAQAIQHEPDLVILDEPMSGLDPIGRREVRDLILSLRAAGRTVLFSSHILQDAEMICDRVAILDRGRVRSVGKLDEMIARKVRWYEVSVLGSAEGPLPAERLARDGEHELLRVSDLEALGRLLAAVKASGAEVSSVWPKRETLEDLFLEQIEGSRPEERP